MADDKEVTELTPLWKELDLVMWPLGDI
jgi:hypothetical protein